MNRKTIAVTDIGDRLLLDVGGGFINGNPEPGIRTKIINRLAKIQVGEMAARKSSSWTEGRQMRILQRRTGW